MGYRTGQERVEAPYTRAGPTEHPRRRTRVRSLDRPAALPAYGGTDLTETTRTNDQNPIDPRTILLTALFCLTTAVAIPHEQLQSLTELLNLAYAVLGRR